MKAIKKADFFAGIDHAPQLSSKLREELFEEAKKGVKVVETPYSSMIYAVSDVLTCVIAGGVGYLILLHVLGNITAALL